jgi:hypothetical protein
MMTPLQIEIILRIGTGCLIENVDYPAQRSALVLFRGLDLITQRKPSGGRLNPYRLTEEGVKLFDKILSVDTAVSEQEEKNSTNTRHPDSLFGNPYMIFEKVGVPRFVNDEVRSIELATQVLQSNESRGTVTIWRRYKRVSRAKPKPIEPDIVVESAE